MDEWKPRRDDHLVEPMFDGLGARHEHDGAHEHERAGSVRLLLLATLVAGLLIALRVALLLA